MILMTDTSSDCLTFKHIIESFSPFQICNNWAVEVRFTVTHVLYMLPISFAASPPLSLWLFMVSMEKHCMDKLWDMDKVPILTSSDSVTSVTPAILKDHESKTKPSPVTTYSHTTSNSPSMETVGRPHWTSSKLCMLTTTVAGIWIRPNMPQWLFVCECVYVYVCVFLKGIWQHGWVVLWFPLT